MIPKPGQNVPNEQKMYQTAIKYPKCLTNTPNGNKMYQHLQSTAIKNCPNWDFWFKNKPSGSPVFASELLAVFDIISGH
jgi:hypothetical protein